MMATDYHNHSLTSSKHSFSDWMSVGFIHWRNSQFWKKLCERKLKHFNCVLKLDSWHVLNNFTPSLMNFSAIATAAADSDSRESHNDDIGHDDDDDDKGVCGPSQQATNAMSTWRGVGRCRDSCCCS